jgi:hypothetical protein
MEDDDEEVARFREVDKEIEEELREMEQEGDDEDHDDQRTGELSAIIFQVRLLRGARNFHGRGPEDQTCSFRDEADFTKASPGRICIQQLII